FYKQQLPTSYVSYETDTVGASTRLGFTLREDLGLQLRYSIYQQKIKLSPNLTNCNNINPDFVTTFPTPDKIGTTPALTPPDGNDAGRQSCRRKSLRQLLRGRRGVTRREKRRGERPGSHLVGRLYAHAQYARQQQESDFGTVGRVQAGFCRPWRRREVRAHDGRPLQLSRSVSRPCRHAASARGAGRGASGRRAAHARRVSDGPQSGARICTGGTWTTRSDPVSVYRRFRGCARGLVLLGRQFRVTDAALLPAEGCGDQGCRLRRRRLALELYRPDDIPHHRRGHLG